MMSLVFELLPSSLEDVMYKLFRGDAWTTLLIIFRVITFYGLNYKS